MRRMDIRIALLIGIVLLVASPVALTTDVPRDSATTVTPDAGYGYEDDSGKASAKGDLNHDCAITQVDALIALQMAARGEYSKDADVSGDYMVTSLDALLIQQTTMARCRIVVGEYTVDVSDTTTIPIRVEGGVDIGSLDLNITFDPTLLSVKSTQNGAFECAVINPERDSGVVKVIAYQAANPGLNGDFTVAEITFEALLVGESPIDLEIVTLTDSSPQTNYLAHSICNGTVTICQT
ncbi:MAG: cohesin domain-containing protein [Euryarchaeota archaeon]|nr:cohesin domain-containing protein [Euryarchaeota archaeon]